MKFTVVTSVYKNDKPEFIQVALDSMLVEQTIMPDEIVIVQDGPVSYEISTLLLEYQNKYRNVVKLVELDENRGLGNALKIGVENAIYDLIARMDSDDICLFDRFEKQLAYMEGHPECDIVGGQITEFIGEPDNIVGKRQVPLANNEIYKYMKSRCALNHVTVMFRKDAIMKVGNYQDWFWNEDYYLWVRMMMNNCTFANLSDIVVNVRSGVYQYARRGGKKYFNSEVGIKKLMLEKGIITWREYFFNYVERVIIQLMLPRSIRGWFIRTFARKR